MGVYLQMLFSERAGIVVVSLGGEKKDLVSSKVGNFRSSNLMRLQSGTWNSQPARGSLALQHYTWLYHPKEGHTWLPGT